MADHRERRYFRPLLTKRGRAHARSSVASWLSFTEVEILCRGRPREILPSEAVEALWPEAGAILARIAAPPRQVLGLDPGRPHVMGIVNATPDSFSDGGQLEDVRAGIDHGLSLVDQGADLLDVGGESTRPGATTVPEQEEIDRVVPVVEGLVAAGCPVPISVDTRKAGVARAALDAGASMMNDVSALRFDPDSACVAATAPALCLMHALGEPGTMQNAPHYDDVVLDVYDFLEERIATAEASGIDRGRIVLDPGIGFGKTLTHNVTLLGHLSLLLGLGCVILLGVSRKGFIGRLSGEAEASRRAPGSIAAGLAGLDEGVQILRVHDVAETVQAVRVWQGLRGDLE